MPNNGPIKCSLCVKQQARRMVPLVGVDDTTPVCESCFDTVCAFMDLSIDAAEVVKQERKTEREILRSLTAREEKCGTRICCTDPDCPGGLS